MKKDKLRALDPPNAESGCAKLDEQSFRIKFQLSMGQTDGIKKNTRKPQGSRAAS